MGKGTVLSLGVIFFAWPGLFTLGTKWTHLSNCQ